MLGYYRDGPPGRLCFAGILVAITGREGMLGKTGGDRWSSGVYHAGSS